MKKFNRITTKREFEDLKDEYHNYCKEFIMTDSNNNGILLLIKIPIIESMVSSIDELICKLDEILGKYEQIKDWWSYGNTTNTKYEGKKDWWLNQSATDVKFKF